MRIGLLLVLWMVSKCFAGPASAPATQPDEPLVGGALRYAPPAEYELRGKYENGTGAEYRTSGGAIQVLVQAINTALPRDAGEQMARQIGKTIRETAQKQQMEVLLAPRVEADGRFLLRIHDRLKSADGKVADRVQFYRVFGVYLVNLAATAFTDSEEEAAKVHTAGAELLAGMRVARGVKPSIFPRTQVKLTPPVDWREQRLDRPNGPVAIYTDERDAGSRIIVRARIVPKEARGDEARREALVVKMIDEERRTDPFTPAAIATTDEVVADAKALRAVRSTWNETPVLTRYIAVGDVVLSVRAVGEGAAAVAQKLIESVGPAPTAAFPG